MLSILGAGLTPYIYSVLPDSYKMLSESYPGIAGQVNYIIIIAIMTWLLWIIYSIRHCSGTWGVKSGFKKALFTACITIVLLTIVNITLRDTIVGLFELIPLIGGILVSLKDSILIMLLYTVSYWISVGIWKLC